MRREGSPFTGLGAVFVKEFADHLGGARNFVLQALVVLIGIFPVYVAIRDIRASSANEPFLYLLLFTYSSEQMPVPALMTLLSLLIPLVAVGLAFDSVNGEFARRTMSRILAQPIYRDALLLGKFLAALATVTVALVALWLLILGVGLLALGVPPGGPEVLRGCAFLLVAIAYAGVWLGVAMLFSVAMRSAASAALCALGVWLFFTILWPIMAQVAAQTIAPPDLVYAARGLTDPDNAAWSLALSRLSPNTLFFESAQPLLNPSQRSLGLVFVSQLQGMVHGAPLPVGQSLLLAWPQITALVAAMIVVFALAYVVFQRQEVRA
ncbi:MAG: ABC transporter permease [Rhodospirillales bacterium]|nr:ABC transporter permease [Rhodospirillales bacterium]